MLQRKLTKQEIENLESYVEAVRKAGGTNVSTRDVYIARHGREPDSYTRPTRATSKAIQKAGLHGFLDVEWDGRTYRASLPDCPICGMDMSNPDPCTHPKCEQ